MLNFGEGSSVPDSEEVEYLGTWVPATPEKPFSRRSDSTSDDMQNRLRRGDCQEQSPFPTAVVQQHDSLPSLAYIHAADNFGRPGQPGRNSRHHIGNASLAEMSRMVAGSQLRHGCEGWDGSFLNCDFAAPVVFSGSSLHEGVRTQWMPPTLLVDSQANYWRESNPTGLMVPSQIDCSSSSLAGGYHNSFQLSDHGFELPHCKYDMNLPPGGEVDAASKATSTIQCPPVTPGKASRLEDSEYSGGVNLLMVNNSGGEQSKQLELVISEENGGNQHSLNEMLDNTVEISSAAASTPLGGSKDPEKESDQFIDLNKTPSQKPRKRRKHRPKVIVEGKPKRTPKAETTKVTDTKDKPTGKRKGLHELANEHAGSAEGTSNVVGKRKYTRKKNLEGSAVEHDELVGAITNSRAGKRKYTRKKGLGQAASAHAEPIGETTNPIGGKLNYANRSGMEVSTTQFIGETTWPTTGTVANSCRRTLSFDLENTSDGGQSHVAAKQKEMLNNKSLAFNLHTCFDAAKIGNAAYMMHETEAALQMNQKNGLLAENRQSEYVNGLTTSMNQMTSSQILFSETQAITSQLPRTEGMLMDGLNPTPRDINAIEGCQIICPEKTNSESPGRIRQIMQQYNPQYYTINGEKSKRDHYNIKQTSTFIANPSSSAQFWPEIFQVTNYQQHCSIFYAGTSDAHKRKTIEGGIQANTVVKPSGVVAVNGSRTKPKGGNDVNETGSASAGTCDIVNLQSEYDKATTRNNSKIDKLINDLSFQPVTCREAIGSTEVHELLSLTTLKSCQAVLPEKDLTLQDWPQPKTSDAEMSRKCRTPGSAQFNLNISEKERVAQGQDISNTHQLLPAKRKGRPPKRKFVDPIEEIIYRIGVLSLDGRSKNIEQKEKNALVPYIGDGAIVPYGKFHYMKKQKPRPKVDIDPETDKVWKMLMGKDGSEGLEGTENEKEKWWEEERKIFSLRVDSFIARMRLVQGDRRFSRWKGSVVDSVIGVFLTQNVSDHLSSSAFMSLAAKYPLKSRRNRTCGGNGSNLGVEKSDAHVLDQNGTIMFQEKLLCYTLHDSMTPHILEEEVLSSQESNESCITQGHGGAGSNSEAEDPAPDCTLSKSQILSFTDLLQMDSTIFFDEFYSLSTESSLSHEVYSQGHQPLKAIEYGQKNPRTETPDILNYSAFNQGKSHNGSQRQETQNPPSNYQLLQSEKSLAREEEVNAYKLYGEESTSRPSTAFRFTEEKYSNSTTERVVQEAYAPSNSQQGSSQPYHESHMYESNNIQSQITSSAEAENLAEEVAEGHNRCYRQQISNIPSPAGEVFDIEERISKAAGQTCLDNKLIAETSKEQMHSRSKVKDDARAKASTARKGKVKYDKTDVIDWDSLRKQVQSDGIKEKTEDTKDSLDYEALRCAKVKEISEAIRERGMNNMLAERMKEFLSRLVSDHGSIDLEWLRDIPPDKAKDYLLSIRGLGLKSVECVRLLTLHHLAFPVDTNVGRIAVRLGWVPLQPLPESLQLHLLELYPILETVQKYLWPRLCKLDRETLYELHYQMITFGKVFCTKSRPNCNACPLRAECRHFASAYASARLALPGPEEKRITTSTVPSMAERKTGTVVNPMLLPMPEENSFERAGSEIGSCIPIVEEPATPDHHHIEVTESDIEDAFEEDPDEIPTIKLNMEEFAMSLQNYMQESSDIQEGDISKALVVLNPAIASIPVPKLKNVSRLRTEHQVYELPDSHPLLNGMDRREPDDPSPYLLAIWAPGETANSTEPPKRQCLSQEPGRLCNEKTCFPCNSVREANSQTVRGTLLIPCRTAMRGSFPLNGTYFQVNEVFADHESSLNPIDVPRAWIWNLRRRIVYFGTSVSTIFKGLSTEAIQHCFWRGFVCVRGFEQKTRAPRPLKARLHLAASKMAKINKDNE